MENEAVVSAPEVVAPKVALPSIEEIAAQLEAANGETEVATAPETSAPAVVEPVVPAAPTAVKPDPASAKFAALARREREARQKEAEAARRETAALEREKLLAERDTKIAGAKSPLEILKAHGYKYEDATMEAVGAFKAPEPDPLDVKVQGHLDPLAAKQAALDAKLEQVNATLAAIQSERVEAAKRQVAFDIKTTAEQGGYEYINALGSSAYTLVQQVIAEYMSKNSGAWLPYKDACDIVEKHYDSMATALSATKKVQSRFATATTTPVIPTVALKPTTPPPAAAKTLTQSHSQTTPAKPNLDEMSSKDALDWIAKNVLTYTRT